MEPVMMLKSSSPPTSNSHPPLTKALEFRGPTAPTIFWTMGLGSRKRASAPEGDHGDGEPPRTKKNKTQVITQPASFSSSSALSRKVDENGNRYWEISKLRRVTVSSFRGKTMVHLREYYEKDGLELPGKKVLTSCSI